MHAQTAYFDLKPNSVKTAANRRGKWYLAAKSAIKRHSSAYDFSSVAAMGKIETTRGHVPISNNPPQQRLRTASNNHESKQNKEPTLAGGQTFPFLQAPGLAVWHTRMPVCAISSLPPCRLLYKGASSPQRHLCGLLLIS